MNKEKEKSLRIRELERKFVKALEGVVGQTAGFMEYGNTTCGEKVIMGKHITITWQANAYEKSVPKAVTEKFFEVVNELYDDVLPARKGPRRMDVGGGGNICWEVSFELKNQENWR